MAVRYKDQTFWFVAYEGWRENGGLPATANVPSQAALNAAIAANGGVINPVIAKLLARNPWSIPLPATSNDPTVPFQTVQVTDHFNNRVDSLILKFDHHLSKKDGSDLLTGRYFYGDSDQSFPLALGGGTTVPGFNTTTPTRVQVLSLSYTHIFTPKLLMEVRGGWNRFAEGFFPEDNTFNPSSIGLNTGVTNSQDFGLPQISFSDGTSGLGAITPSRAIALTPTGNTSPTSATPPASTITNSDMNTAAARSTSFTILAIAGGSNS